MPGYVLEIEIATPVDEDLVDELMEDLSDLHVTVGAPPGEPAHMVISLTIDANDVHQAVNVALTRTTGRGALVGYSVTLEELRDERLGLKPNDDVLTVAQAAALAGVTRQTMFRWVHSGRVVVDQFYDKTLAVQRNSVERVIRERATRQEERAQTRRKRATERRRARTAAEHHSS